jgi:hypothetical protein
VPLPIGACLGIKRNNIVNTERTSRWRICWQHNISGFLQSVKSIHLSVSAQELRPTPDSTTSQSAVRTSMRRGVVSKLNIDKSSVNYFMMFSEATVPIGPFSFTT